MTEPLSPGDGTHAPDAAALAAELQSVIEAVAGVTAVYPARPLWQTIAGAARSAVTGEARSRVDVASSDTGRPVTAVKVRIGVSGAHPAPHVARAVAAAVRQHLSPHPVTVQVGIVQIGSEEAADASGAQEM
ncbi:hypothetical protein [Arthrobacter oryzae]|uniref:Uncharacterized protein n=1 Tax=Arthrobacter oryzae TaxID=409290 RepID=A0A495EF69_9MICC|nr:hypothetical protein [Arthrobacter oryzae]RKR15532.1 hypothetical protein C8D78_3054 [Arthrobacter oryzae]